MSRRQATLKDGSTIEYVEVPDPPAGGMKKTFFTPDKSQVVQFFHDPNASNDPDRIARLEAVLGRFNPTLDPKTGPYWKSLFCWPTAIVVRPQLGLIAPTYPQDYFFQSGPFRGKEKEGRWFSSPKLRKLIPDAERGTWINYFQICIRMARAVRRLHQAGLAHSDLSCKNVLIDPSRGQVVVIDIDSLVVPGRFPPEVAGTPGYIAPEVLGTLHLPLRDPARRLPSAATDQHALAVLIYEYLLNRHPLRGPKVNSVASAEEDESLSMGSKALFVEHPTDTSNRPPSLTSKVNDLGPHLTELFQRAFVKGLHAPNDRPGAIEWERGLIKTWDLLHPCAGPNCPNKYFVLHDPKRVACPSCGHRPSRPVPILKLRKEVRPGQWMQDAQLVVHGQNQYLLPWHAFDNVFPNEEADRTPQGYFAFHQGQWILINQALTSLTTEAGNRVPSGQAAVLQHGTKLRLAQEPHGRIAEIEVAQP